MNEKKTEEIVTYEVALTVEGIGDIYLLAGPSLIAGPVLQSPLFAALLALTEGEDLPQNLLYLQVTMTPCTHTTNAQETVIHNARNAVQMLEALRKVNQDKGKDELCVLISTPLKDDEDKFKKLFPISKVTDARAVELKWTRVIEKMYLGFDAPVAQAETRRAKTEATTR